jgi:hypothetical protein
MSVTKKILGMVAACVLAACGPDHNGSGTALLIDPGAHCVWMHDYNYLCTIHGVTNLCDAHDCVPYPTGVVPR